MSSHPSPEKLDGEDLVLSVTFDYLQLKVKSFITHSSDNRMWRHNRRILEVNPYTGSLRCYRKVCEHIYSSLSVNIQLMLHYREMSGSCCRTLNSTLKRPCEGASGQQNLNPSLLNLQTYTQFNMFSQIHQSAAHLEHYLS